MLEITSRHRPFTLLTIVVIAQVLLLAYQIKRNRDVRLIRLWAAEALTPLQAAGTWSVNGIRGGWQHYIDLRHARYENDQLHGELTRLELRNRELESQAAQNQRLAGMLNFREQNPEIPIVTAQVVGANADASSRTVFINRGEHDRLRKNMAVITPDGVVGKIIEVYPGLSQVLLITDRESGVGVLFPETRTHGIIKGSNEPLVRMDYVINEEKVHAGEEILTSGEDRIFPKDLPVGTVVTAKNGNPFQTIQVRPAARLDRLEEVLVLLSNQDLNLKPESAQGSTSAPADNALTTATSVPVGPTRASAGPNLESSPKPNSNSNSGSNPHATPSPKPNSAPMPNTKAPSTSAKPAGQHP